MAKRQTTRKGIDDAGIPTRMSAMELDRAGAPLRPVERRIEPPKRGHILVRVAACGICRSDLHVIDGDLPHPKTHVIPPDTRSSEPSPRSARRLKGSRSVIA